MRGEGVVDGPSVWMRKVNLRDLCADLVVVCMMTFSLSPLLAQKFKPAASYTRASRADLNQDFSHLTIQSARLDFL